MKNVELLKKNKLAKIIILIILTLFVRKHFFLPEFLVTEKRVEWRGHSYELEGNVKRWVLGKSIGKDSSGQRLYALKGDINKTHHLVVVNAQMLFVEFGYEIPKVGEITGIIAEYTTDPGDAKNFTTKNKFLKKMDLEEIIDKSLSTQKFDKFDDNIDIGDSAFYRIHLCFDDCPVAGKCMGFVGELKGEIYFLRGDDVIDGPSGTEDYKAYIKSDTEYFIIDSEKVRKELKNLKTLFQH